MCCQMYMIYLVYPLKLLKAYFIFKQWLFIKSVEA